MGLIVASVVVFCQTLADGVSDITGTQVRCHPPNTHHIETLTIHHSCPSIFEKLKKTSLNHSPFVRSGPSSAPCFRLFSRVSCSLRRSATTPSTLSSRWPVYGGSPWRLLLSTIRTSLRWVSSPTQEMAFSRLGPPSSSHSYSALPFGSRVSQRSSPPLCVITTPLCHHHPTSDETQRP